MFTPRAYLLEDREVMADVMRRNSFATLVSVDSGSITATHIPLIFDEPANLIIGHVSKANPHWRLFDGEATSVAIFQGEHAYISPQWYASSPNVPTWNYVAIHAHGRPSVVEGEAADEALRRLMVMFEGTQATDELFASEVYRKERHGIVAFHMPVDRLEGKWKMGQNRSREDRESVISNLIQREDPLDRAVGERMRDRLLNDESPPSR